MNSRRSLPRGSILLGRSGELTLAAQEVPPSEPSLRLMREFQAQQKELERQNAELARARAEAESMLDAYANLYDRAPVAYLVMDRSGGIWKGNLAASALLGASPSDLVGNAFPDWIASQKRRDCVAFLQERLTAECPQECELPLRPRNGAITWIRLRASWLPEVEECRATFVDITEQRQAELERQRYEAEIFHAQQLESLGRLAAGVAHDINNILGAIYAVTETLRLNIARHAELGGPLALIEKAAVRGKELVGKLTRFTRKDPENPEPVNLYTLARNQIGRLERESSPSIRFSLEAVSPHPMVLAPPNRLSAALMHLCVNGTDAMAQGGHLSIRIHRLPDDQVQLSVEDTGCGMTPDILSRAHEPFFTTKPLGLGNGQGLSIVLETARAMGGEMAIESRFGQGTTVSLVLPELSVDGAASAPVQQAPDASAPPCLTILFVDDDELMRATIPALFEGLGHCVVVASDGFEALRALSAGEDFDLIVLDHNMPGMTGLETLQKIRLTHPTQPVILATGNLETEIVKRLRQDRWARGIEKPFSIQDITQVMHELLEQASHSASSAPESLRQAL